MLSDLIPISSIYMMSRAEVFFVVSGITYITLYTAALLTGRIRKMSKDLRFVVSFVAALYTIFMLLYISVAEESVGTAIYSIAIILGVATLIAKILSEG